MASIQSLLKIYDLLQLPAASRNFSIKFKEFYRDCYQKVFGELWIREIAWPISKLSEIGRCLYWPSISINPDFTNCIRIEKLSCIARHQIIDGVSRPIWQCFEMREPGKQPLPIYWGAESIGIQSKEEFPVYMQSHAINRWHERLPQQLIHPMMLQANLSSPTFYNVNKGEGLIAYGSSDYHFGYFRFKLSSGCIILQTFLFLTMSGTPEYRKLEAEMGLTRPDIEYHKLDRVETYFCSNIQFDIGLAAKFKECGLGHLLRPAPEIGPTMWDGLALTLRNYMLWT